MHQDIRSEGLSGGARASQAVSPVSARREVPAVRRRSHVRPGEMGYGEVYSCSSDGPVKCAVMNYGRGSEEVTARQFLPRPSAGIAALSITPWLKNTLLILEIIHLGEKSEPRKTKQSTVPHAVLLGLCCNAISVQYHLAALGFSCSTSCVALIRRARGRGTAESPGAQQSRPERALRATCGHLLEF